MENLGSVSKLICKLDEPNSQNEFELWNRCIEELIRTSKKKLKGLPRRTVDEEDVAILAFNAFLKGQKEGRFKQLDNREDLWQILTMLAERNAIKLMRQGFAQKRGEGNVRGESVFANWNSVQQNGLDAAVEIRPEFADTFVEVVRETLGAATDKISEEVALKRMEGYSNQEIAEQLGVSVATVERKFKFLRERLEKRLGPQAKRTQMPK